VIPPSTPRIESNFFADGPRGNLRKIRLGDHACLYLFSQGDRTLGVTRQPLPAQVVDPLEGGYRRRVIGS